MIDIAINPYYKHSGKNYTYKPKSVLTDYDKHYMSQVFSDVYFNGTKYQNDKQLTVNQFIHIMTSDEYLFFFNNFKSVDF